MRKAKKIFLGIRTPLGQEDGIKRVESEKKCFKW